MLARARILCESRSSMKFPKNAIIVIDIAGENASLMYDDLSPDKQTGWPCWGS